MEIAIIALLTFIVAGLTFFTGFGLATILMPVLAFFFPVDIAIALTGVIHFANNLFRVILVGGYADPKVLVRFGIPAVVASFAGAWLLLRIAALPVLFRYAIGNHYFAVMPVNLMIALMLVVFSLSEIFHYFERSVRKGRGKLVLGGVVSGFFGGLTGIQGALRGAFLIRLGLPKEAYIATSAAISCFVDFTRLSVYATRFTASNLKAQIPLLFATTAAAVVGSYVGKRLLPDITSGLIRKLVVVMLLGTAVALGGGWV